MLAKLTDNQLTELYNRIVAHIYEEGEGGTKFGVDFPTLRLVQPRRYAQLIRIRHEGRRRFLLNPSKYRPQSPPR